MALIDDTSFATLTAHPLFRPLAEEGCRQLAAEASTFRFDTGEHVFHTGGPAESFYLIKEGSIRLYRPNHEGNEKVFQILHGGDLVAETAMFAEPCLYPLSAQAESAATLYRFSRDGLLALARRHSEFCMHLLATMSARIYQAVNRIDHLTVGNASQRLVMYLLDLCREQRSRRIHFPVSNHALARQLNITPETLSRQLHHFKRTGLMDGKNRDWVLLDLDALHLAVGLPSPGKAMREQFQVTDLGGNLFGCCNFR